MKTKSARQLMAGAAMLLVGAFGFGGCACLNHGGDECEALNGLSSSDIICEVNT